MPEINTYDYELLAAFIVGTLTLEQQKAVQERISSEPDFDKLYPNCCSFTQRIRL